VLVHPFALLFGVVSLLSGAFRGGCWSQNINKATEIINNVGVKLERGKQSEAFALRVVMCVTYDRMGG
jgi:hypothetical protein